MRSTGLIALHGARLCALPGRISAAVFAAVLLFALPAAADDADATYRPASQSFESEEDPSALIDELARHSAWRLSEPVDLIALAELAPHPLNELHFEDSDLVSRLSKLRGLSMLTMAEVGPARLFFGVNDEGLVGLHFNTGLSDPDDVHVEVWRLPYLQKLSEDAEPTGP